MMCVVITETVASMYYMCVHGVCLFCLFARQNCMMAYAQNDRLLL